MAVRVGSDVGGTFTDVVLMDESGRVHAKKVLSTPPNFNRAVSIGLKSLLDETGTAAASVQQFLHGATVATNAIITRTGAKTGLLTTFGFRDVLEIRRMRMNKLYDINWQKPPPLVPRNLRREVVERIDSRGSVVAVLDEETVRRETNVLLGQGCTAICICFINSYANGEHERRTAQIVRTISPQVYIGISSEILPEMKEYERTSTTVINAYVQPIVSQYFEAMRQDVDDIGIKTPIMVMQSNGGMTTSQIAARFPMNIVESGPAAGVTGAFHLASRMGLKNVLTLDMGGTTAKAALIEDGVVSRSPEYEVGGEMSIGHRLLKGSGYLLRVPSIDIGEVGAGGGSIAWCDSAGALKVGPNSAGAEPGPACYGRGGSEPTVTDANVLLGFTNPVALAGGTFPLDPGQSERAVSDRIAKALGLDVTQSAWGIRTVAKASLVRAIRAVSIERGRDPRRFVMFAFGGMGPVHAVELTEDLGMDKVVIPPLPGLFSALGLLFADVEHHFVQTFRGGLHDVEAPATESLLSALAEEGSRILSDAGFGLADRKIDLFVDLRYLGQDNAITVPMRQNGNLARELRDAFEAEHQTTFGYASQDEEVQIVAFRCIALGLSEGTSVPSNLSISTATTGSLAASRRCYFGADVGWLTADVIGRDQLSEERAHGPLLIEEDNSTTPVPPGWTATIDNWSNIIVSRR
jgi:N-methylhydantoinase A